ncbi:MAG TPA: ATP-binding cassette domain-containing protein, partial [Thermoanaerobaculia bacterium]|nr:ATP-binding cassette domain-containing protein [Thermoanaerobaculia bacterium]
GEARFQGESIYRSGVDLDELRARIGMLFQQPVVFPRSIYQNVIFGARRLGSVPRRELPELAESALTQAALWQEVRDRLHEPATRLSVGQQQRLCLARALAVGPEIILMDEPTSALDPKSSEAIEELILGLKERLTIVLVSHNLGQVRRVADWLACMCTRNGAGEVVESACCDAVFRNPQSQEVVHFLSGSA